MSRGTKHCDTWDPNQEDLIFLETVEKRVANHCDTWKPEPEPENHFHI